MPGEDDPGSVRRAEGGEEVPAVTLRSGQDGDARPEVTEISADPFDDVAVRRPTLDDVFLTLTGRELADEESERSGDECEEVAA